MTIKLLVHENTPIAVAEAKAAQLGCPIIHHGRAKWMANLPMGNDGYLGLVMCSIHDARREILAVFTNTQLTAANMNAAVDHPPDPPTQEQIDKTRLHVLSSKLTALTATEIQEMLKLLGRYA